MSGVATIKEHQANFLNDEIWTLTFNGRFQHSSVYAKTKVDKEEKKSRDEFRDCIKKKISCLVEKKYKKALVKSKDHTDHLIAIKEWHTDNLITIKKWIDENYSGILKDGKIKLGVVQKLFNLCLKYQWCLGLVKMPPHGPFDRTIIAKMNLVNKPAWTKLDGRKKYEELAEEASKLADEKKQLQSGN